MDSLAPRVTPLLTSLIYDPRLSAPLLRSFLRLYAAAWPHDYRAAGPLDFQNQLLALLGLCASQAHRHLRQLRYAGFLDWHIDSDQRYVICFPALDESQSALKRESAFPHSVVGVNRVNLINLKDSQQQHTHSPNALKRVSALAGTPPAPGDRPQSSDSKPPSQSPDAPETSPHPPDETLRRYVLDCLARAGVWSDVARRIADRVCANQLAGDPHQPGVADVLGWIAYCFSEKQQNSIHAPAAVLAHNLEAGRRCPEKLRPQPLCARCQREHNACACPDGPQDSFPPDYIEAAFKERHYDFDTTRWGVCLRCRALPCQCPE